MKKARLSKLPLGLLLVVTVGACASTERRIWTDTSEPALLVSGPAFELHLRRGKVALITPAQAADQAAQRRVIEDIDEFRRLYADASGAPLEAERGSELKVNGWVGLDCVRAGQACGVAPVDASRALILLRFR